MMGGLNFRKEKAILQFAETKDSPEFIHFISYLLAEFQYIHDPGFPLFPVDSFFQFKSPAEEVENFHFLPFFFSKKGTVHPAESLLSAAGSKGNGHLFCFQETGSHMDFISKESIFSPFFSDSLQMTRALMINFIHRSQKSRIGSII